MHASPPTPTTPDAAQTELLLVIARLVRRVSPVGATAKIAAHTRLREDLALDSVASLELLSMIDDELGLCLEMEDVIGIDTVGGIVALAEQRFATTPSPAP
jgi:acyl carrier protein